MDNVLTAEQLLNDGKSRMATSVEILKQDLKTVRTGRATPSLVEGLMVDYYGTQTPLGQLSTISTPEAQLILIQPWDRNAVQDMEKAISKSDLGLNPSNDGNVIRIPIPPLNQERREELVRSLSKQVEEKKIAIRNVRRDVMERLRALEKNKDISQDDNQRAQVQLQKLTDSHIAQIDTFWNSKIEEMMKV